MKNPTPITQQELSSVKHILFAMVQSAEYWDGTEYSAISQSLKGLNFKKESLESFTVKLIGIVRDMIDWDDVAFDMEQLYKFQDKLKQIFLKE